MLWLEEQFDRLDFPQRAEEKRSFWSVKTCSASPAAEEMPLHSPPAETKILARLAVHVLYRQHTSWQGNITWIDKGEHKEIKFRSALELLHIICDVLKGEEEH